MVSVVLPIRNAAATLPAALDSLLAQTLTDFEVIAIDDGSSDHGATQTILFDFARRDARIRPIAARHHGIVAALNRGLAEANSPLIARMDADDVCHPERLARQAAYLAEHPEVSLVSCRAAFGGDAAAAEGYAAYLDWANALLSHEQIAFARFRESPLPHPTVMFRAELAHAHGGYRDGSFPEDFELWLRWIEAGAVTAKLPETLYTLNDPPGRLSRTHPRYALDAFYRIKAGYLARHLARVNPHHPKVIVAGAGRITRRRAEHLLEHGIEISAWLDIDPRKIGKVVDGRPVLALTEVPGPEACFVLAYVGSRGASEYIAGVLEGRGFELGTSYLPAA